MVSDQVEIIKRRRNQLVIHSLIYYEFNANIIDDYTYDAWSKELAELQAKYPSESAAAPLSEMFADFDGSTGYQLVGRATEHQRARAESLLRYHLINGRTIKWVAHRK